MVVAWLLLPILALLPLVQGHPAGTALARREVDGDADIVVYDSSVASPIRRLAVVVHSNQAHDLPTRIANVLMLPTNLAPSKYAEDARLEDQGASMPTVMLVEAAAAPSPAADAEKAPAPFGQGVVAASNSQEPSPPPSSIGSVEQAHNTDMPVRRTSAGPVSTQDSVNEHALSSSHNVTQERFGVSYAPYDSQGRCKQDDEVDSDIKQISKNYSLVRIYGTGCDQARKIAKAAKAQNLNVFLGIWNLDEVAEEAELIIAGFKDNWDSVRAISVGNELFMNGKATVSELKEAASLAHSILSQEGYSGPLTNVEPCKTIIDHPELCKDSKYVGCNAHAYFDGDITAAQAGNWLESTVAQVKQACQSATDVVVTETGWPTNGTQNRLAVAGPEEQMMALKSIQEKFIAQPENVILFSAFDDKWKDQNIKTFFAERHWGILKSDKLYR